MRIPLDGGEGQSLGWAAGTSKDVEEGVGKAVPLSLPFPSEGGAERGAWQAI